MRREELDRLKMKAAILYILEKLPCIGTHTLAKILFFADQKHLALYGRKVINDTYIKMPKGPVPSIVYDAIKTVKGVNSNESFLIGSIEVKNGYKVISGSKPEMDFLSVTDVECLDQSIEENGSLHFYDLTDKSHGSAWESALMNGCISDIKIVEEVNPDEWIVNLIHESNEVGSMI
jgi:uncharacterized phage-associated protein